MILYLLYPTTIYKHPIFQSIYIFILAIKLLEIELTCNGKVPHYKSYIYQFIETPTHWITHHQRNQRRRRRVTIPITIFKWKHTANLIIYESQQLKLHVQFSTTRITIIGLSLSLWIATNTDVNNNTIWIAGSREYLHRIILLYISVNKKAIDNRSLCQ